MLARRRSLACLSLLLTISATAQNAPDDIDEPPAPPKYRVEVIFFAHTDANPNEEIFGRPEQELMLRSIPPAQPPLAIEPFGEQTGLGDPATAIGLAARNGGAGVAELVDQTDADAAETIVDVNAATGDDPDLIGAVGEIPGEPTDPFETIDPFGRLGTAAEDTDEQPFSFRLLRSDEFGLTAELGVVRRLGAYRVLGFGGWIQDGLDEDRAQDMNLSYLGITNPRGSMRLYLGRFLHVALDVEYQAPSRAGFDDGGFLTPFDLGQWYELETERNAIRSGELHYIDHPMFGVLLRVTPFEDESEVVEDDTDVLRPAA